MADLKALEASTMHKRSVGAIEMGADGRGRRSTIQVEDLGLADRALAEQFGYKPVRPQMQFYSVVESPRDTKTMALTRCAFAGLGI